MDVTPSGKMCARCDKELAIGNKNEFGLCGACQNDLAHSRERVSAKLKEWIDGGRQRLFHRTPKGMLRPLGNGTDASKPEAAPAANRIVIPPNLDGMSIEELVKLLKRLEEANKQVREAFHRQRAKLVEFLRDIDSQLPKE